MKVTFLGTGTSQGVPVIGCECEVCQSLDYRDKRLRSSVHVSVNNKSIVIDSGPDFRQQMLRERIQRLDAILFTHAHKDHIAGLDDVRAYNYLQKKDMPVYGTSPVLEQIKAEFYYAFEKFKYPGTPQVKLIEMSDASFSVQGIPVIPLPVLHYKLPVMGFRINDFSYITDANQIPDTTYQLLKGTKIMVLNSLQREKHLSHFNLEEALDVAGKIGAEQTYLIHISHKLGTHRVIEKELPKSVTLAYDGLSIEL